MSDEDVTQMAPGLAQAFAAQEENEEQGWSSPTPHIR